MSRFPTRLALVQTGWHKGRAEWETLAPLTYRAPELSPIWSSQGLPTEPAAQVAA